MSDTPRYVGPTPERLRRAGRDVEPVESETGFETLRMLDGSPLEKLATTGKRRPSRGITGDQYHAGVRYYGDAYAAGLLASGVIDPARVRVDGGRGGDVTVWRIEAQGRFAAAVRALDRVSVDVLSDVVISEVPLAVYADRFRKIPLVRERRVVALHLLRTALDQLDEHYLGRRHTDTQVMHEDGYRPVVGGGSENGA